MSSRAVRAPRASWWVLATGALSLGFAPHLVADTAPDIAAGRAELEAEELEAPPAGAAPAIDTSAAAPTPAALSEPPQPAADGDVTEAIDAAGGAVTETIEGSPSPAPHAAEAPEPQRAELGGWVQQRFELSPWHAARGVEPSVYSVPHDRFINRSQASVRGKYTRGSWLEVDVSGLFSYALFSASDAPGGESWRGELSPELHDLYVGLFWGQLDVRVGQQRLAWGRGEFISPNDVLNARDSRDYLLSEPAERQQSTPLLRVDYGLEALSLEFVLAPFLTPDRFDVYGSNWSAIQAAAPAPVRGLLRRLADVNLALPDHGYGDSLRRLGLPDPDASTPSFGFRASWSAGPLDVNHYYHYGFDSTPDVRLSPDLQQLLASTDFSTVPLSTLAPLLDSIDQGHSPLLFRYRHRHHVGSDISWIASRFLLRLDSAYETRRVFYDRSLSGVVSPTLQTVFSVEYQTGKIDQVFLFEAVHLHLFDKLAAPLLIYDRDSWATAALIKYPLGGHFGLTLRGIVGIRPITYAANPELNLSVGDVTLSLGALAIGGAPFSLGGYFTHNDEGYARVRWAF